MSAVLTVQNMLGVQINVHPGQTVLQALQGQRIDWMHACGAKGRCTTCRIIIIKGEDNLTLPTPAEDRFRLLGRLADNERLSCQCGLLGPVTCRVPRATQLPHQHYGEAPAVTENQHNKPGNEREMNDLE